MAIYRFKEVSLPREPACAAIARRLVEQDYGPELDVRRMDDLRRVVGELVDNAYLHGDGQIRLRLVRQNGSVRVAVMDEGDGAPVRQVRTGERRAGNGLRLVDQLSTRWGVADGRTHVWADMAFS